MPYVEMSNGEVIGTFARPQYRGQTFLENDDPLVLDHMGLSLPKVKQAKLRWLRAEAQDALDEDLPDWVPLLAVAIQRGIQSGQITNATQISRFDATLAAMVTAFGGVNNCLGFLEASGSAVDVWVIDKYRPAVQAVNAATTVEEVMAVTL